MSLFTTTIFWLVRWNRWAYFYFRTALAIVNLDLLSNPVDVARVGRWRTDGVKITHSSNSAEIGRTNMENAHVYLDTSTGSEATISEQGILTIRAHEAELGNMLGQVTLEAQEAWILLQWLYSHTDMLHQLTHQDEDVTTKLRADD